jgi:hypothetical protein
VATRTLFCTSNVRSPSKGDPWKRTSRIMSTRLVRKPEMHDVAVSDDVLLAFEPELAGARAGLAVERDIIGIGDGLGANESLLEIGVDHPSRGWRPILGAAHDME